MVTVTLKLSGVQYDPQAMTTALREAAGRALGFASYSASNVIVEVVPLPTSTLARALKAGPETRIVMSFMPTADVSLDALRSKTSDLAKFVADLASQMPNSVFPRGEPTSRHVRPLLNIHWHGHAHVYARPCMSPCPCGHTRMRAHACDSNVRRA